ncbi:MAG: hypothetical protein QM767_03680 [Anaeromyxobacter sp.]
MVKVMLVLRTLFLAFIVIYTIVAMPLYTTFSLSQAEDYSRCRASLLDLIIAAWLAIAWIVIETVVGWWHLRRERRRRLAAATPPATPPATPAT